MNKEVQQKQLNNQTKQGNSTLQQQSHINGENQNQYGIFNQQTQNDPIDSNNIDNLIFGYQNSQEQESNKQQQQFNQNKQMTPKNTIQRQNYASNSSQSYKRDQQTDINSYVGSNAKNDNSYYQSSHDQHINISPQRSQFKSNQFSNIQHSQQQQSHYHMTATDFLRLNGNKINCGNVECSCSESSWALVRDYLRQLKQLSTDHLLISQENKRLNESNKQYLDESLNLKNQIAILEQKILFYEKENSIKLSNAQEKIKSLEIFNKDLFNKVAYYEQTILNYEQDLNNIQQDSLYKIQSLEEDNKQLQESIDLLHDRNYEQVEAQKDKYEQKIDRKNSKIKSLKHKIDIDKNLIKSYKTELEELQIENKQIKDELENFKQGFTQLEFDYEDNSHKYQLQEIKIQSQLKFIEELKKKNEEYELQISQMMDNLQSGGEEKLKQYYQTIQQQVSQVQSENLELRNNLHTLHQNSLAFKEGIESENQNNIYQVRNILTNISTLIISKGKEGINDQENNSVLNQQSQNFDLFQDVQSQIIKLIQQNHKRKKEKKKLQQKCKDFQEKEQELQNTIHVMTTEREQELYLQQQLKIQQIQQQQFDQLQNFNRQQQGSYRDHNSDNSTSIQYVSPKLTFQTHQFTYQQQNQQLNQSQLSQQSQQSHQSQQGLIKDFIDDSVQKLNKSEQITSFQTPHLPNSSVDQVSNGDLLERLRKSTQQENNDTLQKLSLQRNESYQNQIQEILQLKDTHYNTIINDLNKQINDLNKQINDLSKQNNDFSRQNNDLNKQYNDLNKQNKDFNKQITETHTQGSGLIYIFSRINRLSGLLKQQTTIVFSLINSQQQLKQNNSKNKITQNSNAKSKLKAIVNSLLFIKRFQKVFKSQQNTNKTSQQFLLNFNPSQITQEKGLKHILQSITKDIQNDFDLYKSVRQIIGGQQQGDINQNINFKDNELIKLINQINQIYNNYESNHPIINKQVQLFNIKSNNLKDQSNKEQAKDNINREYQMEQDSFTEKEAQIEKEQEVQKEKEIVETENIYLKDLIVNLKEENDQIQQKLSEKTKQCQNYYVVLQNYEIQIQKLQNENEINLEKNSRLIDMIDPKDRAILEKQSVLEDLSEYQDKSKAIDNQQNTKNAHQNIKPK